MPLSAGSQSQSLLASLPSFMSVFGDGLGQRSDRDENALANNTVKSQSGLNRLPSHTSNTCNTNTQPTYIYRRNSGTTLKSESSDSSPTTTISTVDSTLTEPSPSSSPESPSLPLSSYTSLKGSSRMVDPPPLEPLPASPAGHLSFSSRSDSPNKKMRNTKNLSLNTSGTHKQSFGSPLPRLGTFPQTATAVPSHAYSAPASPTFILPPKPPKRKPSTLGLTITTPESNFAGRNQNGLDAIPQTPALASLNQFKHLQSVSNMSVFSPTMAPEGGMQLPPFGQPDRPNPNRTVKIRPTIGLSQSLSFDSAKSSPIVNQILEHVPEEADHDLPLSREVKSPAYPEGPVCIYDSGVYLYLEPNDTEASEFDVVINVAREVRNPYEVAAELASQPKVRDVGIQVNMMPMQTGSPNAIMEPPSAVSEKSFQSAFEILPSQLHITTPDTPKAKLLRPEYIHIPWDHNTHVVSDLMRLCELIDNRVSIGKKVLVHCQCGVSRSASLIVAYGLYKNPELSVQEAYDTVKEKSRWIGPNMHLIYQLAEFKTVLSKHQPASTSNLRARRAGMVRNLTDSGVLSQSRHISPTSSHHDQPNTAPLERDAENLPTRSNSLSPPGSAMIVASPISGQITPGPSSAPPDMQFSPTGPSPDSRRDSEDMGDLHLPDAPMSPPRMMDIDSEPVVPVKEVKAMQLQPPPKTLHKKPSLILPGGFSSMAFNPVTRQLPLRREFPSGPGPAPATRPTHVSLDHIMTDAVPETPSILSPRAAEFTASPFHRTVAGDLAGSSVFEQNLLSPTISDHDPRSPPTRGEVPITRNIDSLIEQ